MSRSSSFYEDCDVGEGCGALVVEDDDQSRRRHGRGSSDAAADRFHSADSQFFDGLQFPPQERTKKLSWGAIEIKESPPSSSSPPQPEVKRSQSLRSNRNRNRNRKSRSKSVQFFEDLFSAGDSDPRLIYIDDPKKTNEKHEFTGNDIHTSKYTLLTFLPKNLFIQFHRVAYTYFFIIAVLNQLPPLAVFGRTVSLFPLLFVLCVTAIKDGYEDYRRHRSDRKENNQEARVHQSGKFRVEKWKLVLPGEVVKVHTDETIPCDMVLLGTSDMSGVAYIQTMNLDGESNLKTRYARQETTSMVEDGVFSGFVRCEQPNRNIYDFKANMEFGGQRIPLSQSNIILRGCQLKNTKWVIGVAVYTGQETKAMLNSEMFPSKRSTVETYMNRETLWLSFFLIVMCAVVATGMGLWLEDHKEWLDTLPYYRSTYITDGQDNGKRYNFYGIPTEIVISFLSSVIVFQIMIPISLYITMELVRLGQSYFMIGDIEMYDNNSGAKFQCRSLNINEDLGQIRYIFSDKTGTLTENIMEFRRACIYGKDYGSSSDSIDHLSQDASSAGNGQRKLKSEVKVDPKLAALLNKDYVGENGTAAHNFFFALSTCNTVIPMTTRNPNSENELIADIGTVDYQGESPDEQSLVAAASAYGYTLFERASGHVVIIVNGEKLRLDVLGMHEFDSVRKRMSVVIRFPNNTIKVFVKGADTSMLSILEAPINEGVVPDVIRLETENHLNGYSSQGLRTLVIAGRDLTDEEFEEWRIMYEEASTSLSERSAKLRQAALLIECNLKLLGATGIEDKLQDGVPEAIESLRQAGIKVWVLTGDKQETAISIGLSCKLLTNNMQQIIINGSSEDECRKLLADAKSRYGFKISSCNSRTSKRSGDFDKAPVDTKSFSILIPDKGSQDLKFVDSGSVLTDFCKEKVTDTGDISLALIIDGNSLVYILENDNLEQELFDLATSCDAVLCCRVAPLQKAGIVDLIKSRINDMTLAIGDGANDVSMIQMADVGVGICGQEGRQAVMASDFAMGQFRFLKRLLLVHGHWNYHRIGYLVLYNFYRNAVFVLMLFWYILCTAFSTTSSLTDWSSVFYSLIYTSLPTLVVGILDKDLSHKTLLNYPKLYSAGHRQESYNVHLFWVTMIDTLWQSLVLFYIPVFIYRDSSIDIWSLGSIWTISVVVLVNVHLAMDIQRWVLITHIATWGSIFMTGICIIIIDSIPIFPNYGTIYHLASSKVYWLTILVVIIVALLPRFLCKFIRQLLWPSDIQIAREAEMIKAQPFGV